jgi:hypothetical protein
MGKAQNGGRIHAIKINYNIVRYLMGLVIIILIIIYLVLIVPFHSFNYRSRKLGLLLRCCVHLIRTSGWARSTGSLPEWVTQNIIGLKKPADGQRWYCLFPNSYNWQHRLLRWAGMSTTLPEKDSSRHRLNSVEESWQMTWDLGRPRLLYLWLYQTDLMQPSLEYVNIMPSGHPLIMTAQGQLYLLSHFPVRHP